MRFICRMRIAFMGLVAAAILATQAAAELRTWTDRNGKTIKNAEFIRIVETTVILKENGRLVRVSYFQLSDEDQLYVRRELKSQGKEKLIPKQAEAGGQQPGGPDVPQTGTVVPPPVNGAGSPPPIATIPMPPEVKLPGGTALSPPPDVKIVTPPTGVGTAVPGTAVPGTAGVGSPPGVGLAGPMPMPGSTMPGSTMPPGSVPGSRPPEAAGASRPTASTQGTSAGATDSRVAMNSPSGGAEANTASAATNSSSSSAPLAPGERRCGKCNQVVSASAKAGDKCPHCGVLWADEVRQGVAQSGQSSSAWLLGGGIGGLAVVAAVIYVLANVLGRK